MMTFGQNGKILMIVLGMFYLDLLQNFHHCCSVESLKTPQNGDLVCQRGYQIGLNGPTVIVMIGISVGSD
jgi:hypothetical protein